MSNESSTALTNVAALELVGVSAGYGNFTVLRDIDLTVGQGQVVALLGLNGAGKTTLIKVAAGELRTTAGKVLSRGKDVTGRRPEKRARDGICVVPEGRGVFPNLSVKENLRLQLAGVRTPGSVEEALEAFPDLKNRLGQAAGTMSGGQQQMLALARCFTNRPSVVLLDEVSMGLAPRIIDEIFEAITRLATAGVSILLVEQYISRALAMSDHVYVLDRGRTTFSGAPRDIDQDELAARYLSGGEMSHS